MKSVETSKPKKRAKPLTRAGGESIRPKTIRLPIEDAKLYYSQGDEDRFYGCFYALPEYVDVARDGKALQLTLKLPLSRESFYELVAVFTRYNVSLHWLRPALSALSKSDRAYFSGRPTAYWFEGLIGNDEESTA